MIKQSFEVITSVQNETIRGFSRLKEKKYRDSEQKFLVEGFHLVCEAQKTSLLEAVMSSDIEVLKQYANIKGYLVTDQIIQKLSATQNPQNILGVVQKSDNTLAEMEPLFTKDTIKCIILDQLSDPGNLGTMIRTAAGLGYDAIFVSEMTVDLWNDKTLRASQGAIFKIPVIKCELFSLIAYLKRKNVTCLGTALQNATALKNIVIPQKFALCFGNEAHGVRPAILDVMDQNVQLFMKRDVESFNVMVASSIIMYEFIRNEE